MPPIRLTCGQQVFVKRNDLRVPAAVVETLPASSLVWVRIEGELPTLIDTRDLDTGIDTVGEVDQSPSANTSTEKAAPPVYRLSGPMREVERMMATPPPSVPR
jgi:hypothetical protein